LLQCSAAVFQLQLEKLLTVDLLRLGKGLGSKKIEEIKIESFSWFSSFEFTLARLILMEGIT